MPVHSIADEIILWTIYIAIFFLALQMHIYFTYLCVYGWKLLHISLEKSDSVASFYEISFLESILCPKPFFALNVI